MVGLSLAVGIAAALAVAGLRRRRRRRRCGHRPQHSTRLACYERDGAAAGLRAAQAATPPDAYVAGHRRGPGATRGCGRAAGPRDPPSPLCIADGPRMYRYLAGFVLSGLGL